MTPVTEKRERLVEEERTCARRCAGTHSKCVSFNTSFCISLFQPPTSSRLIRVCRQLRLTAVWRFHSRLDKFPGVRWLWLFCTGKGDYPGTTFAIEACKCAWMSAKTTADRIMCLKRFSCNNQTLFTCIRKRFSSALRFRHVGFIYVTLQCSRTARHVKCFWD